MYKSLLVATDGSETASEAVRIAMELAKELGATLHVVSVY
jgi:nucleotide-binding universal stress UspA family protein